MHDNRAVHLIGRMSLAALVIGTSVTVSATERLTLPLILAGWIGWSFVPVLQLLTGLLLVRGRNGRRVTRLDGYFATQWPWALWIIALHAAFLIVPAARPMGTLLAVTAVAPIAMTIRLLLAFCRDRLAMDRAHAWRRVGLHQAATYLLIGAYVWLAVALWPRLLGINA